jgi:hypothetical protein
MILVDYCICCDEGRGRLVRRPSLPYGLHGLRPGNTSPFFTSSRFFYRAHQGAFFWLATKLMAGFQNAGH